ncbi:hydroxyethylthiazole kinase [Halomonas garicola]|uniref:hydroxyethylthiazole kinase n=1 Tax=Halomonas garicola TaxID=1690008 RepID=UPI00289D72D7|nr:hydroxyethylthiazole kinase [Halomonas garicola]
MALLTSGGYLQTLQAHTPLVHCITNFVAMNSSANILLALGASPAMLHAREEAGEFTALADALSINIGTVSPDFADGMRATTRVACDNGTPWVLDPVAVGATAYRRRLCAELMERSPTLIRGNASEILCLNGMANPGRGADSTASTAEARDAAVELARRQGCLVGVSGEVDLITDGERITSVYGGHALMPRITTLGCGLSATAAAFLGVADATPESCFAAATTAFGSFSLAGERAAAGADGPGSFTPAFLDALYHLQAEDLDHHLSLEIRHGF